MTSEARNEGSLRRLVRRLGLLAAYPVLWVCDVGINLCDYDMEPLTDVRRRSRAAWLKAWKSVTPNARIVMHTRKAT